jgi:hypothetical protein
VKKAFIFLIMISPLAVFLYSAAALGRRALESPSIGFERIDALSMPGTIISQDPGRGLAIAAEDGDSIFFRQPSGAIIRRVGKSPSSKFVTSQDGSFIGIQDIFGTDRRPRTTASIRFTLYTIKGRELWSVTEPLDADEPVPSWYISSTGRVVSVRPARSRLRFIDLTGSVEKAVELFPDAPHEMERPIACAFSADGRLLAVNALQSHPRPGDEMTPRQRGESYLMLFTGGGEELWRRRLEEEIAGPVAISDNGNRIAAVALSIMGANRIEMKTHLYDDEGQHLAAAATDFRLADFSSDGSRLLLSRKSDLMLVESATGRTIWEDRLDDELGQIRAADLSSDGTLALAASAPSRLQEGRFTFTPVHAVIYDDRGKQIWKESFPDAVFDRPAARFLPDGGGFSLIFQNRYLIYGQE